MKLRIVTALSGLVLLAGTAASFAQDIIISPEQETVIREYVHKKPVASLSLPGFELNLGSRVPDDVELYSVEAPDVRYRYVVIDDRTVLVDPDTRQIVRVID